MHEFVHLHVHTEYSMLDGLTKIKDLVNKAIEDGMRGVAITDHGNMMGIKELHNYCKTVNKKLKEEGKHFTPIIGCEVYVAERNKEDKDKILDKSYYHLILLAKNEKGYKNLIKIVSRAWVDGLYGKPRTDHADIEKYHEGLICCSGCIAGELPRAVLNNNMDKAREIISWYKSIFGDDYYLELQRHQATVELANHETYPLQQIANAKLLELGKEMGVKVVCTNDVHFLDQENADAHELLICINTKRLVNDPGLMRYTKQEWFKTTAEMNNLFADIPQALDNTIEILDKVEEYDIDHPPIMPFFEIPSEFGTEEEWRKKFTEQDLYNEFTSNEKGESIMDAEAGAKKIKSMGGYNNLYRIKFESDYLKELTFQGAKRRYGDPLPQNVIDQLIFELHIMKTMGFPGYFLIVQDFINAARNKLGVIVGPGRGSAAGSVVAYCLGITQIDPLKYDLLFERFLNPDRISLPDIDVDFEDDKRDIVLQYVTEKYGAEKVAHIITYNCIMAKTAIKDVARALDVPLAIANDLCKYIPPKMPDGKDVTLTKIIPLEPKLQEAEQSTDPALRNTIRFAKMLEGNVRNQGVHACGTIICRDDITDWVPVSSVDDKSGHRIIVTEYEGRVIEDTGLIKMDFLGLKTLSVIREALKNVKLSLGIDVDIDSIPIDDKLTFDLYSRGDTIGTFQFESPGMQKYLRELQPSVFEDLIAMNALYRPGPIQYIPEFIDRKLGRKPIEYDLACMEKYLKDTYGITVYQEQVMLLSREIANFTRGESDTLRKAMGKKLKDKMDHLKVKFLDGGKANGHKEEILEKVWKDWESFASYAFNKSHATCYSWVAYQTAYLKAHYPSQYMAATLSQNLNNIDEITKLLDECHAMNLQVLGPSINHSQIDFGVDKEGNIRFGLAAVKGVGEKAAQSIVDERNSNGPFTSVYDFFERLDTTNCNSKAIESLVISGAFDCFENYTREQYFGELPKGETMLAALMRYSSIYKVEKNNCQTSLFGDQDAFDIPKPQFQKVVPWSQLEKLSREKELVGFCLSGHPLDDYKVVIEEVCTLKMADFDSVKRNADLEGTKNADGTENTVSGFLNKNYSFGGIVVDLKNGVNEKQIPYGIITIEDYSGKSRLFLNGQQWGSFEYLFKTGNYVYVEGSFTKKWGTSKYASFTIADAGYLSDKAGTLVQTIAISLALEQVRGDFLNELESYMQQDGNCKVTFRIEDYNTEHHVELKMDRSITVTSKLIQFLKNNEIQYKIN